MPQSGEYKHWLSFSLPFNSEVGRGLIFHLYIECVEAIGGLGLYITRSFGKVTTSSLFIPQTILQNIIIFEAVSKVSIHD